MGADPDGREHQMGRVTIRVNGLRHAVTASPDTPLLYVLRNELRLHGPRFGCGLAQCGSCTVQLGGCVMQGISRSLIEELKWDSNRILSRDWATYAVVRFKDMPAFDFQVISRPDQPAVGAGEVLITNMPAAISNAIFDATGKRMRQVPFTRERVKAALTG